MNINHFVFGATLTLAGAVQASAEIPLKPESPFRVYSVAEGLNQKTVLAVTQDHDGFVWVATFGGLNRFDGRSFDSYTTRQGLRQNLIQALAVDRNNRLWAGDTAGGLTLIEDSRVTRTFKPEEDSRGVARCIVEVGDTLYIGSQPGGLRKLSLSDLDRGPSPIEGAPGEVLALVARSEQEVYILSSVGLHLYQPNAEPTFSLIAKDVSSLRGDGQGLIAVGDKAGRVGTPRADGVDWFDTTYDGVVSELIVHDGQIEWVVLEGQGIINFADSKQEIALPLGGSAPALHDQEGVLWVPSRAGLARFLGSRFRHYPLEWQGVRPEVFSILPGQQEDYWFGTSLGLLHVENDGVVTNMSDHIGIQRREVRDIRLSSDSKTLWFGHVRGAIQSIDLSSMTSAKSVGDSNFLTVSLELDGSDRVWSGSYLGTLSVFDPHSGSSRNIEVGDGAAIYSLDLADDGYLWFSANYHGIFRINTLNPDAQPELIVSDDTLGQEFFTHVVVEGSGVQTTVWFASIQGGVFRWHDGEVERVILDPGLSDYTIYSITPLPDNTLVLTTSRGVYRYDLESNLLEHYTALDGFVAIEAKVHASYLDADGSLIIGTTSGVSVMDVRQPMSGVGTPIPRIIERKVDDIEVNAGGDLPESASVEKVSIKFTAISTRKPFGLEYSYRLAGQDDAWGPPTQITSIGYSNLHPGRYEFQVRARLPGGQWSSVTRWAFDVPTPFWRTHWFIMLALASAIALTWSVIQLRLRSIARANRRLRIEVAERTESIEAGRLKLELSNAQLCSEIREREKADALRAEVEARFHQAYQNSPIGMALVDTNGLVYDANPKMKHLFWPASPEGDRQPLITVVAQADQDRFADYLDACASEDTESTSMEVDCTAHGGQTRRIDFHPSAVRDHEGRLKYIVLMAHDVTERRAMTNQLAYQASFDELTGLVNRRAFSKRLEEAGTDADRRDDSFLMFLDLDQFKIVNDSCGHAAGDELLGKVARLITRCVRQQDTVARLGGDEFGVILVGCTQRIALQRAEDVRQCVQDLEFIWNQDVFRIGVSIGVVPLSQATKDLTELQQLADAACYAAKEAGRNRVHLVAGKGDAAYEHRGEMRWVHRLNQAIDSDNFVLFGQRILGLGAQHEQVERVEILLRMQDRKANRLIPPGAFLPAAERYGLQGRLDQWVVSNVIDILQAQDREQVAHRQFWVNLSGASVGDLKISRELIRSVEEAGLPAGCLNFEITETAVIRKIDDAAELIEALQAMGCRFALDDFGSGLSSFGYLKRLNVDCIKIDGQFVRDITTDPTDRIFVKSIIDIAHTLGMRVVTEFVEDQRILEMVRSLGSDYAQGFGIHRPEPLTALVDVSSARNSAITGG